jgi:hypothetical protein
VDDLDTGTWGPLESQLTIAPARHLYVTTYSESESAMLFASTDSGIFISTKKNQSGQWQQTLQKHAYGVTSFTPSDPKEWFAAVEDGVYRYDENTPVHTESEMTKSFHGSGNKTRIAANFTRDLKNVTEAPVILFSPNGKQLGTIPAHGVLKHAPSGVVITRTSRQ